MYILRGENMTEKQKRDAGEPYNPNYDEELGIEISINNIIDTFVVNRRNKSLMSYYDVYFMYFCNKLFV